MIETDRGTFEVFVKGEGKPRRKRQSKYFS